jgi:hypothetical protein
MAQQDGSVLTITPVFNSNDEIHSCNFTYTDPTGKSSTQLLVFNYTKLAPITSVTLNIGGYGYGLPATFTSGQGTITYSASQPLTAQAAWAETAETSNIQRFAAIRRSSSGLEGPRRFRNSTRQALDIRNQTNCTQEELTVRFLRHIGTNLLVMLIMPGNMQ